MASPQNDLLPPHPTPTHNPPHTQSSAPFPHALTSLALGVRLVSQLPRHGSDVLWHSMVAGLAAGQGAAATGAWLGGARMDTLDRLCKRLH